MKTNRKSQTVICFRNKALFKEGSVEGLLIGIFDKQISLILEKPINENLAITQIRKTCSKK
jgi:hypothetical protein